MDDWIDRLQADTAAQRVGATHLVDAWLAQTTVRELIDVSGVVEAVALSASERNIAVVIERLVDPAWDRHRARAEAEGDRLGDYVPDAQREALLDAIAALEQPRAQWAKELIDTDMLRELLAPALQLVLTSFTKKLPLTGKPLGGLAGGLAGKLSAGSSRLQRSKIGSVGRSVIGNVEERFAQAATEFSRSAVAVLREGIAERLASEEGAALLSAMRRDAATKMLEVEVSVLMAEVDHVVPRDQLAKVIPAITEHASRRDFIKESTRSELTAMLGSIGDTPLLVLLKESGAEEAIRKWLNALATDALGAALADAAFTTWLRDVSRA